MDAIAPTDGYSSKSPIERRERGDHVFARAARHSRYVRLMKWLLPVTAIAMIVAFVGYSMMSSTVLRAVDFGGLSLEGGGVVMANPKLEGFTKTDLPYSVTADKARQKIGDTGAIRLEGIKASVPIDRKDRAAINAKTGTFDRSKNMLDIDSEVTFESTSGIKAHLQSAKIDIGSNTLSTNKPVDIKLKGMHIAADGLKAANGGGSLVFNRNVRVSIDPARLKDK